MLIMNIGSVDPNFTGVELAGAGNAQPTMDLEIFGTHKRVLLPCKDANLNSYPIFVLPKKLLWNNQAHSLT
jgi:hypothetical protein